MRTRISPLTKSIRKYLLQGMAPKDIVKKLKIDAQKVYNVQYYMRKREEAKAVKDAGGIAAIEPKSGTGIASWPYSTQKEMTEVVTTTPPTKPTLWQRVKAFFNIQL
jgi:hypothetical protein